ncbi:hypothetical protein CMI47_10285 [Candidatus Pacearchaeota archaeon]|nr:hypothetical protein [Candidatus Pacearchaeota archaeon]|tara:strand:+ start:3000 stop:3218 length:219 start_codon:yes stop_codon:yes gene_type:complete
MHDQLDPAPPKPETPVELEALRAMNKILQQYGHQVGITDSELSEAGEQAELVITRKGQRFLLSSNDLVECIS